MTEKITTTGTVHARNAVLIADFDSLRAVTACEGAAPSAGAPLSEESSHLVGGEFVD